MLKNWTEAEFDQYLKEHGYQFECGAYEQLALQHGRFAIIDNPELEILWDNFVKAYRALNDYQQP